MPLELHQIALDPVNDPIAAEDNLPNPWVLYFRHNPSGVREVRQASDGCQHIHYKKPGVLRRIGSNKIGDRFQIICCLSRPSYFSHSAILALTAE